MTHLPPLDPAVAATRVAVRRALADVLTESGAPLVLVALSGGADSLALAAATAFEAPKQGVRAGAVIVDHGLQVGSGTVAERAATQARTLGLEPVAVRRVRVTGRADGPEAAARAARYAALEAACREFGAAAVFTGHTSDDQAEQVLLAMARGSGTRALAGIPARRGVIRRPLLRVSRAQTAAACAAQGLSVWADPHNSDPGFTRVRVRTRVLPMLEHELGLGIAANLVRTAEIAREDAEALDVLAAEFVERERITSAGEPLRVGVAAAALAEAPAAIRHRVIRMLARESFGGSLSRTHTLAVAALVTDWRGQGPVQLPGGEAVRVDGTVTFRAQSRA